jgi:hypothetical protein
MGTTSLEPIVRTRCGGSKVRSGCLTCKSVFPNYAWENDELIGLDPVEPDTSNVTKRNPTAKGAVGLGENAKDMPRPIKAKEISRGR